MRIVLSRRLGDETNLPINLPFSGLVSFISARSSLVREKKATSEPETKAEQISKKISATPLNNM
jgi:hypothetical protein